MSSRLHVIALISGGKDSLFSILHCLAQGHEIVALANLYPAPSPTGPGPGLNDHGDDDKEDIDSYMYQTVGHSIIPLYAAALNLPLYRQPILGSAVNTSKVYTPPQAAPTTGTPTVDAVPDETESLLPLLTAIIAAHPTTNALSTGAILSTYQRTRVESVAARLNLVPLSFLWQYPSLPPYRQSSLLEDMRAVGQESRIVKVASGGLDEGFLWEDVADERVVRRLEKRMARFGAGDGAVLGEGGEFETLAVDGPARLWRGRIKVAVERVVRGEGGSAVVKLAKGRVVAKEDIVGGDAGGLEALRIPGPLDDEFKQLLSKLQSSEVPTLGKKHEEVEGRQDTIRSHQLSEHVQKGEHLLYISNLTARHAQLSPTDEMTAISTRLKHILEEHKLTPSAIVFSTLLLRSMADFTTLNPIYGSLFTEPTPPARITVACGNALPDHVSISLSVIVHLGWKEAKRGLHVQSRSYWAPANIGPYSQAVAVPLPSQANRTGDDIEDSEQGDNTPTTTTDNPEIVYIAGQIPLVPATMDLIRPTDLPTDLLPGPPTPSPPDPISPFRAQTLLALQHLFRIGRAVSVSWWAAGVAYISACAPSSEADARARLALRAWQDVHGLGIEAAARRKRDDEEAQEDDERGDMDVWDMKHGLGASALQTGAAEETTRERLLRLPDYGRVKAVANGTAPVPPCFVVQVDALPRGADVEWAAVGLAGCDVELDVSVARGEANQDVSFHVTKIRGTGVSFLWAGMVRAGALRGMSAALDEVGGVVEQVVVYAVAGCRFEQLGTLRAQVVPCRRIWDGDGTALAAAVMVRYRER